ncbi:MAG: pilus assembly protein PilM, partial [Endozoicomonadaceae bacterium]|nr:pilus assembly protein PilM [Endozoicomonadaceae bacterium]
KHLSVDHVVLSGGMIAMDLLEKQTESLANIPCCIANPCSSMRLSSSVDKQQINQMAPALYVACGLAMRTV